MRKHITMLSVICLLITSLTAAEPPVNLQKIHPVDSEVYQAITQLYIIKGLALPSTAGPWSTDELLKMLSRIDRNGLPAGAGAAHDFAATALGAESRLFRFGLAVDIEAYVHTDTQNFNREADWIRGFNERRPFLDIVLETWPAGPFYGYSSFSFGLNKYNGWDADGPSSTLLGQSALTTNVLLVPPSVLIDLDFNFPYRAFGAAGGDGWSFQVGRDKLSWGPGVSGNFVLGDHWHYHNQGRFTSYGKNFKYTLATSFFPHPANYYPREGESSPLPIQRSQADPIKGLNMFVGHRLEWRMLDDKVGLALVEAIMYQSLDNTMDLRVLSPTAIFHNFYIRGNANSIISLELDWSPITFLNLYGQIVLDEFALPGEPVPGVDEWALPDGYGFMLGAKGSYPLGRGILFGSAEWARTDPYLYLRDGGAYSQLPGQYGINFIAALREFSTGSSITYTEDFIGYQYGGDAIVLNGQIGYRQYGHWDVTANFFHMLHGTHDKWTLWSYVYKNPAPNTPPNVTTPTDQHYTGNNGDLTAQTTRDAVSATTVLGISGSYRILPALKVYGQADFVYIKHPGNISSNAPISDVQLTIGCSYSF
jgi:hypothetical protein